ncbi:hypothetical protein D9M70_444120 [compost metagenome]
MQADDVARATRRRRDLVDTQARRVGGQDRGRFAQRVQAREDFLLHGHVFEHGLDDQIGLRNRLERQRRRDPRQARFNLLRLELALGGGDVVVAPDQRQAAVERGLFALDQRDRNAGVDERHGDPHAHRSGTQHRHALDRPQRRALAFGELRRLPFGEEDVAQRLRFIPRNQFFKADTLERQPFGHRQFRRRFHAADAGLLGQRVACFWADRGHPRLEIDGSVHPHGQAAGDGVCA